MGKPIDDFVLDTPAAQTPPASGAISDFTSQTDPSQTAQQPAAPGWLGTLADVGKSAGTGALTGLATTPGAIMDIVRLAELGVGKLTGDEALTKGGAEGLGGGWGGSEWMKKKLQAAGVLPEYTPTTEAGKWAYNIGDMAAGAVGTGGAGALLRGGVKGGLGLGARMVAKEAAPGIASEIAAGRAAAGAGAAAVSADVGPTLAGTIGRQALTGAGSGAGMTAADEALQSYGGASPWTRTGVDLAGALLGGGLAGGVHNLALARTDTDLTNAFKTLGVKPRFPSDVNPEGGMVNQFLSKTIPNRFGAQTTSRTAAATTQDEISKAAQEVLGVGYRSPSGDVFQNKLPTVLTDPNLDPLKRELIMSGLQDTSTGSKFNLDQFMTNWQKLPGEQRNAIFQANPQLREGMQLLGTVYDGTAQSRSLAEKAMHDALHDPSVLGPGGLAGGLAYGVLEHGIGGSLGMAGAGAAAMPIGSYLAAKGTQGGLGRGIMEWASKPRLNPGLADTGSTAYSYPVTGRFYDAPAALGATQGAISSLPSTYTPPTAAPTPPADKRADWLGGLPRDQAVAYVGSKLGPQIAQQLAGQSNEGYSAALMQLSADPKYRQALMG